MKTNFPEYMRQGVRQCFKHAEPFAWAGNIPCPLCAKVPKTGTVHYEEYDGEFDKPYTESGRQYREQMQRSRKRGGEAYRRTAKARKG